MAICIQWNWFICHLVINAAFDGKSAQAWNLHRNIQECEITCRLTMNLYPMYSNDLSFLGEPEISRIFDGLWITISGLSFHIHCLLSRPAMESRSGGSCQNAINDIG